MVIITSYAQESIDGSITQSNAKAVFENERQINFEVENIKKYLLDNGFNIETKNKYINGNKSVSVEIIGNEILLSVHVK